MDNSVKQNGSLQGLFGCLYHILLSAELVEIHRKWQIHIFVLESFLVVLWQRLRLVILVV